MNIPNSGGGGVGRGVAVGMQCLYGHNYTHFIPCFKQSIDMNTIQGIDSCM